MGRVAEMNGILVSAVVLAWVVILLLVLGYAGLLGQIQQLKSGQSSSTRTVIRELAAPGPGTRAIVLAVGQSCETCADVFARWPRVATDLASAGHRCVVVSLDGSRHWAATWSGEILRLDELSSPLLIAFQPALLMLDHDGRVLSADPVGSADGLVETARRLLPAGLTTTLSHGSRSKS